MPNIPQTAGTAVATSAPDANTQTLIDVLQRALVGILRHDERIMNISSFSASEYLHNAAVVTAIRIRLRQLDPDACLYYQWDTRVFCAGKNRANG